WSTLIDAFLDASVFIAGKSLSLAKAWEGLAQDLSCTPVRILLRNSREYATASDLIPAEAAQVSRGDVPYFFGFLGQKSIFYHSTTAELDVVELGSQETMLKKQAVSFCPPFEILSKERLIANIKLALLQLTKIALRESKRSKLDGARFHASQSLTEIRFESKMFKLRTLIKEKGRS
ncbi:MAG TPA: hypothetical protein PKC28_04690, partial [Bdellovibrionales bacterium]|nr:hypothetical protein [Bdellovibrionales bacterium]